MRLRSVNLIALFVVISLMNGCAGVHPYDGAKDELAQSVKTRYEEVDLTQHLALQRENLDKLLAQEKDIAGQVTDQLRGEEIWLLAQGRQTGEFDTSAVRGDEPLGRQLVPNFTAPEKQRNYPSKRLRELGIKSNEALEGATVLLAGLGKGAGTDPIERDRRVVDRARQVLEISGWANVWPCDRVLIESAEEATKAAGEAGQKSAFSTSLKNYRKACLLAMDPVWDVWDGSSQTKPLVDGLRELLQEKGWRNIWSCDLVLNSEHEDVTDQAKTAGLDPSYEQYIWHYREACAIDLLKDGAIRNAYAQWRRSQDKLDTLMLAQRKTREVVAGLKPNEGKQSTSVVEQLQEKVGEIRGILDKLGDKPVGDEDVKDGAEGSLKRLGIERVLTSLRINDIGILLKAVHHESLEGLDDEEAARLKENTSLRRAAVLAAGLPGFGNSVEALIRHLRSPDARPGLLIHYAYQSARLDYLNQRAELVEERAGLQRDQLRALLEEADYFEEIRQFIAPEKPDNLLPDLSKKTLAEVWDAGTPQEKRNLYRALIAFENSFSVARRRGDTVKYQFLATWERQGVLADEYALNAWNSVLAGPIEQLAAYHGSGVKPETYARIFNGLAGLGILGYIGVKEAN